MKKNRITLTEKNLQLISTIKMRKIEIPSNFNNGKYIIGAEDISLFGGSDLLFDASMALGCYDKHIEGTSENYNGIQFPPEVENEIFDMYEFIVNNIDTIESLVHYYSNKGGLTPGTYNTITFEKYFD